MRSIRFLLLAAFYVFTNIKKSTQQRGREVLKRQDYLRKKTKLAKALNDEWSYKAMSEVIDITPHAFYNWLSGFYELSNSKRIALESLLADLIE